MKGRLIYLMGPSGAGKDSLLQAAHAPLAARGCQIARRVITRSAEAVGEVALAVSADEFADLEAEGAFAMSWRANGLAYGIPKQIDDWLMAGCDVLVNGSRGYLPEASQRYPNLLAVLLDVNPAVLRQRLADRGREGREEIEARMARNYEFATSLYAPAVQRESHRGGQGSFHILDNSGALEVTVQALLEALGWDH